MITYQFSGDIKTDKSLIFVLEDILLSGIHAVKAPEPLSRKVLVRLDTSVSSLFEMRFAIIPQYALDRPHRPLEFESVASYIRQIDPIVDQLQINNSEKYRLVYYILTKRVSQNEPFTLARIEVIKELIEQGKMDAAKLINLVCCTSVGEGQAIPVGCVANYDRTTGKVIIYCGSKRNIGRYKQVVGQVNRILRFTKIELVL
jgi:hypothetical protein